jgi:exonuclease SbcD
MIKLVDKQAILDVMVKLRAVYPNVLHLERPGLMALKQQTAVQPAQLNANEISMFKGFFQQVTDRQLSIEEVELVSAVIDDLHHAKDEALNKPVTGNLL